MKSMAFKNPKNKKQSSLSVPEKLRMYVSKSMFYPASEGLLYLFDSQKVQEKLNILLPGSQIKAITPQQIIISYKGYVLTYLACNILEEILNTNKRTNGKVVFSLQKIHSPVLVELK